MLIPKFDLYKVEWLDLVFQNRNKAYGAYELRKHHNADTAKALSITLSTFVVAAIVVTIISHRKPQDDIIKVTEYDNTKHMILPPKEDKPLQAKPAQPKPAAPLTHHNTVVIPTHITTAPVTTEPPTQIEINTSAIGTTPDKGVNAINGSISDPAPGVPGGTGVEPAVETGTEVTLVPEVNPEPVGGMAGWSKFLQRNIRYPDTEAQGRVIVSFIVERDGSLTDIKVMRGVSPELDNEALRVLKMAPKWKPGLQAGKPVRVQFNIPINFQLNN